MKLTPANLIGDLVERMVEAPPNCMFCGQGNIADETGQIGPYLHTRLERNWGDSCYICEPCGMRIGGMFGLVSTDDVADIRAAHRALERQLSNLQSKHELLRRRYKALNERLTAALTTRAELKSRAATKKPTKKQTRQPTVSTP